MIPEKVLYTDGHEVTVTDSSLKVKNSQYQLRGITNYGIFIIHPYRIAPFLLAVAGFILVIVGAMKLVPINFIPGFEAFSIQITQNILFQVTLNTLAVGLGIVLLIAGTIIMRFMRDHYAIRIATAEGEKNVLVSARREYINQILDALNRALLNLIPATTRKKRVRTFYSS